MCLFFREISADSLPVQLKSVERREITDGPQHPQRVLVDRLVRDSANDAFSNVLQGTFNPVERLLAEGKGDRIDRKIPSLKVFVNRSSLEKGKVKRQLRFDDRDRLLLPFSSFPIMKKWKPSVSSISGMKEEASGAGQDRNPGDECREADHGYIPPPGRGGRPSSWPGGIVSTGSNPRRSDFATGPHIHRASDLIKSLFCDSVINKSIVDQIESCQLLSLNILNCRDGASPA